MLLLMKGDELNKRLKKLVEKYRESLKEYILDLYYEEKYDDLRSEIEVVKSLNATRDMKLKEIKEENSQLSSKLEFKTEEKDLRDIARELEKIVGNKKDMESFEYLLRRHYVKSNMSQVNLANRANVEYTTLNKILNNKREVENISKDYIIKLCLGLNLNMRESQELLMSAGYVLLGISERELFIRAAIQEGLNIKKEALIISDKSRKINQRIINELNRGVTLFPAEGGYTGKKRDVLLCIISRSEVTTLKEMVAEIDQDAFVIISNIHEVLGEGFAEIN